MSRFTGDNDAQALADANSLVVLARLDFASGVVRVHSRTGSLTVTSEHQGSPTLVETYLGVGTLGAVSAVDETAELRPTSLTLTLSGLPDDLANTVYDENYRDRRAELLVGFLDPVTQALVDPPEVIWAGRMDTAPVRYAADGSASIELACVSILARWAIARDALYTDAQQQQWFPGDRALDQIPLIQDKRLLWNGSEISGGGGTPRPGTRIQ